MTNMRPSLWRVAALALVVGLAANVFLWSVSATDDVFAAIIAIASGVAAVAIVVAAWLRARHALHVRRWACLLAFTVWTANLLEFATEDGPAAASKFRQCGFYAAFAVLALGAYVGVVIEDRVRSR